jgi:hypothetical protein
MVVDLTGRTLGDSKFIILRHQKQCNLNLSEALTKVTQATCQIASVCNRIINQDFFMADWEISKIALGVSLISITQGIIPAFNNKSI